MYLIGRLFSILRHACKYGLSRFSVLNLLLCWGLKPVQRKRQRAVLAFRVEFTWRNKSGFFCWIIELLAGLLKTSWSQKVRRSVVQSHWSRGEFLLALYIYLLSYLYVQLYTLTCITVLHCLPYIPRWWAVTCDQCNPRWRPFSFKIECIPLTWFHFLSSCSSSVLTFNIYISFK